MKEHISRAIAAHGGWKVRLIKAIETGKLDTQATAMGRDDQCEFGKWLNGVASKTPGVLNTSHYKTG